VSPQPIVTTTSEVSTASVVRLDGVTLRIEPHPIPHPDVLPLGHDAGRVVDPVAEPRSRTTRRCRTRRDPAPSAPATATRHRAGPRCSRPTSTVRADWARVHPGQRGAHLGVGGSPPRVPRPQETSQREISGRTGEDPDEKRASNPSHLTDGATQRRAVCGLHPSEAGARMSAVRIDPLPRPMQSVPRGFPSTHGLPTIAVHLIADTARDRRAALPVSGRWDSQHQGRCIAFIRYARKPASPASDPTASHVLPRSRRAGSACRPENSPDRRRA